MQKLLVLAVVSVFVGLATAQPQKPCADVNTGAYTPKIPLPSLPTNQFKAVVRAFIVNKNMTVEATEYVDETLNMAALKVVQQGTNALILMSYPTNEVFYMVPAASVPLPLAGPMACERKVLSSDDNTQLFGMRTDPRSKYPHLYSTSKILNFINGSEVYKGPTTISGIPVNKWSSCVYWSELHANFTLDYYFTVPGWKTPSGLHQIPVRAEVRGQTLFPNGTGWSFHHIYQYVNFEDYVQDPEAIFTTPPGVLCLGRNSTMKLPKLNKHFYFREEISSPPSTGTSVIQETDMWYDYDLQLVRFDRRGPPEELVNTFTLSTGPFSVIHDFSVGVQYTIARDTGSCSINPIPLYNQGFDAVYNVTTKFLDMRSPARFFNLDKAGYIYAGIRTARGQQCHVFQNLLSNLPGHGQIIYEVYFLSGAADITDKGSQGDTLLTVIPMRIMIWEQKILTNQYEIHDFDQDSPLSDSFDVTPCFPGKESIDFELFMRVSDTNMMPVMAPYLKQLLALDLSISSGVSPVRLQRARLHWNQWAVYFQATILDAAPPIAKFEQTQGKIMAAGMGKALPNVYSDADCAGQCDNQQEFTCMQFDYCSSSKVCTMGRYPNASNLLSNSGCNHYRRVLGGTVETQTSLSDAWMQLKNQVFHKQVVIELPLPDSSGKVDVTVDTSKLDSTQKVTFTAFYVTNEVVSSVNRNPSSSSVMNSFQTIPNKVGKGYKTLMRGLSVDDCASNCVGELTYNCQSFHYCWDSGACFLSDLHPDERPDMLRDSGACDLYFRDYTSNFQKYDGVTLLSASNTIYQDVRSVSQCAKLCTYYSSFHCESFDFCPDVSACYLGQTHYYDTPAANIKQAPSCSHYSRNYIQDFVVRSRQQIKLRDNRIIQDVTAAQCAKLCVQEGSFTCNSFDYCGNFTECRLSDAMVSNVGQVTLEATAYCDVYTRQYGKATASGATSQPTKPSGNNNNNNNNKTPRPSGNGGNTQKQTGNNGDNQGYSGGAMGGLAIAMIVLGLILGITGIVLYSKFFGRRDGDGMTVAFSKQMEAVSTD